MDFGSGLGANDELSVRLCSRRRSNAQSNAGHKATEVCTLYGPMAALGPVRCMRLDSDGPFGVRLAARPDVQRPNCEYRIRPALDGYPRKHRKHRKLDNPCGFSSLIHHPLIHSHCLRHPDHLLPHAAHHRIVNGRFFPSHHRQHRRLIRHNLCV